MTSGDDFIRQLDAESRRRRGLPEPEEKKPTTAPPLPLVSQGARSEPPRVRLSPDSVIRGSRGKPVWTRIV